MIHSKNSALFQRIQIVNTNVPNWMRALPAIYGVMVSRSSTFLSLCPSHSTNPTKTTTLNSNNLSTLSAAAAPSADPNPFACRISRFLNHSTSTGYSNCPSGYDESEEECGTARKLLELPGSLFAALGCIAAVCAVCCLLCMFGLVKSKNKDKAVNSSKSINGLNGTMDYKKDSLFMEPGS